MFLRGFFKHPVMVGSIVPSSGKLIRKMLGPVDWENTKLFVEYGPGVGTFCPHILALLPADAKYIAIDTNPDFIRYLRHEITDPASWRLAVSGRCARDRPRSRLRSCRLRSFGPAFLDPARGCWRRYRPGDRRRAPPRRRVSGLSILAQMPRLHRRPISPRSITTWNGGTSRRRSSIGPGRTAVQRCRRWLLVRGSSSPARNSAAWSR